MSRLLKLLRLFIAALWSPAGKERGDLLPLVGDVYGIFVTYPCGVLGQVVSFPDLWHFFTLKSHSIVSVTNIS